MSVRTLPEFARPPVVEVVVGISFASIPALDVLKIAKLHSIWATDYPLTSVLPPLPPPMPIQAPATPIQITFDASPKYSRVWMMTADSDRLIQVQSDRLVLNWRLQSAANQGYPRYESLRDGFDRLWRDFRDFLANESAGTPHTVSAEVTFVNTLQADGGEPAHSLLSMSFPDDGPGQLFLSRFQYIQSVKESQHGYTGTVSVTSEPWQPGDNSLLNLTVTTLLDISRSDGSVDSIMPALDTAHDLGVIAFTKATNAEAHKRWDRTT